MILKFFKKLITPIDPDCELFTPRSLKHFFCNEFGGGNGGGGGSPSYVQQPTTQTVNQTNNPPEWLVPHIQSLIGNSNAFYNANVGNYTGTGTPNPTGMYPGPIALGPNSTQQAAANLLAQNYNAPDIAAQTGLGALNNIITNPNPGVPAAAYVTATNDPMNQASIAAATNTAIPGLSGIGQVGTGLGIGTQGALTDLTGPAAGNLGVLSNAGNIAGGAQLGAGLGGLANGGNTLNLGEQGTGLGLSGLANTAAGNMLNSNPYLDSMFNTEANQIGQQYQTITQPGIESQFAAAGRLGSGAEQTAMNNANLQLANSLSNLAANTYGQNYQQGLGLQQAAQQQLLNAGLSSGTTLYGTGASQLQNTLANAANASNTLLGTGANAAQNLLTTGNTDLNSLMAGGNAAGQLGLTGANTVGDITNNNQQRQIQSALLAPSLASQPLTDASNLLSAGNVQQQLAQQGLAANIANFYEPQTYAQQQLQNNAAMIYGVLPAAGGTASTASSGMTPQPVYNSYGGGGSALGGIGTGLSVLGGLFSPVKVGGK